MAKNQVAKISVGIEAKVDGLAADMKKAESTVKSGAKNIEQTVESAATRMERSWTEAFSKIGVIMQVADMAQRAVVALSGAFRKLTEDGVGAGQRVAGALKAVEDAGIPVISQGLAIGRILRDQLDGTAEELENIAKGMERLARINEKVDKQMGMAVALNSLKKQLGAVVAVGKVIDLEGNKQLKLEQEIANTRSTLRDQLEKQIIASGGGREKVAKDTANKILAEFDRVADKRKSQMADDIAATKRTEDEKAEIAAAAEKAIADRKVADDKKANELRLSNTKDLESKILQMELEAAGKSDEARQEAIRRSYEKQMKGVTDAQRRLLGELMGLELAAAGADPMAAGGGGGGMTSYNASGVSLRFSAGGMSSEEREQRKSNNFLEEIAKNTRAGGGGLGILPPAA